MPAYGIKSGLLSAYKGAPSAGYLRPDAEKVYSSYGGYPVVSSGLMGLNDYFKGPGKNVAGMAWGGAYNPPGQGGPSKIGGKDYENQSIIVNPYMFKETPSGNIGANSLIKLEALRHHMSDSGYTPSFKITPELQKWREKVFGEDKNGGAGEAYLKDDNAFKQTVLSRIMVGDSGPLKKMPMPIPSGAKSEVSKLSKELEKKDMASKPTISESLKQLIFKK